MPTKAIAAIEIYTSTDGTCCDPACSYLQLMYTEASRCLLFPLDSDHALPRPLPNRSSNLKPLRCAQCINAARN
jgi:hypothetical protein